MNPWMDAEHHAEMAQQFIARGQWRRALHALSTAIELAPDRPHWYAGLGMAYEVLGQPLEAAEAYQQAIDLGLRDTQTLLRLTLCLIRSNRCESALRQLEQLTRREPDCEQAYCQQILAYGKLGQQEDARLMFDVVMQTNEHSAQAHDYLAHSHVVRQEYDAAVKLWERVLELDPTYPGVLSHLGQAHMQVGRLGRARKLLRQHLRREPQDLDSTLTLARLLLVMNRNSEADEVLRIAAENHPGSAPVQLALGDVALKNGHLDAAASRFRRAISLDPACPGARLGLAMILADEDKETQARSLLLAELACDGHTSGQMLKLCALLIRLGMAARAVGLLTSMLEANDAMPLFQRRRERAEAYHHRGAALLYAGEAQRGMADVRRALRYDRTHAMAMQNMILAYLETNQPLHAGVLLRRYRRYRRLNSTMRRLAWRWRWQMRRRRVARWLPWRVG